MPEGEYKHKGKPKINIKHNRVEQSMSVLMDVNQALREILDIGKYSGDYNAYSYTQYCMVSLPDQAKYRTPSSGCIQLQCQRSFNNNQSDFQSISQCT